MFNQVLSEILPDELFKELNNEDENLAVQIVRDDIHQITAAVYKKKIDDYKSEKVNNSSKCIG